MYLKKLWELFRGVDWRPLQREVRGLYNTEGRGRRPKPPLGYLRAVLVKMLWEITSYRALVERLENNPDLNKLCGFNERKPPSRTGVSRFLTRLSDAELDRKLFSEALYQLQQSKPVHRGRPKRGRQPEEQWYTTTSQSRHGAGETRKIIK